MSIGVNLFNMPIGDGSTMRLVLASDDPGVSHDTGDQRITSNQVCFLMNWPANAKNTATLSYTYKPAKDFQPGMRIEFFSGFMPSPDAMKNMLINGKDLLVNIQREKDGFVYGEQEQILGL